MKSEKNKKKRKNLKKTINPRIFFRILNPYTLFGVKQQLGKTDPRIRVEVKVK